MSKKTFIGIVTQKGTKETRWNGLFKYDTQKGYTGSILSTSYDPESGKHLFAVPRELEGEVVHCVIDGSQFGTIVWPILRGVQVKNFVAHIRELQIRTLIKGVHIGASEHDIVELEIDSPIISQIFKLVAFTEEIQTSPFYKITIESAGNRNTEISTSLGMIHVGVDGFYSPAGRKPAPSLSATSYLKVIPYSPITPGEAFKIIRRIEHLLSLLTFAFVRAKNVRLKITAVNPDGVSSDVVAGVDRAHYTKAVKTEFDLHQIPIRLVASEISPIFDRFSEIFDDIEQTLSWYRIVTAERRYMEDKFFYCVRMVDALYKTLQIPVAAEDSGLKQIKSIIAILAATDGNEASIQFLKQRAIPIFSRPSLAEIINDVKTKYSDMKVVELLDHKTINRLRGKEVHGSARPFSAKDYQYMSYTCDVLRIVYILMILERCGLSRSFLVDSMRKSHRLRLFFLEETLNEYRQSIEQA